MHAETLFNRADLPFHRPTDYFAEMVKTDAHMAKIRQGLLDEQAGMKASEEARKLRDAKKFGKKVQHERLRERERDKKAVGDKLESLKKRASSLPLSRSCFASRRAPLTDAVSFSPRSQVARATLRSAATTLTSRSRTRSRRPGPPRRSARRTRASARVVRAPGSRAPGATRSSGSAAARGGGARRTT